MIRLVVLLLGMAVVLYAIFWAIDRRNSGGSSGPARQKPRGPIGPDDDDAFLRNLDWENLKRERLRSTEEPPPTSQENNDLPE
ncbi:MAG: hypothetical protein NTV23_17315 [Propionibacteriales bacterium]|nr:hypothetical protein [Propionibacteriales bacterium]